MKWISIEEVLLMHVRVIDATGGAHGILNIGAVYSAIQRPMAAFGGESLFPSIFDKVAALVHSIIAFHPFTDGNKRTAFLAGDAVLRLNGLCMAPPEVVSPFFWSIARGEQDVAQIAAWLTQHTAPIEVDEENTR